MLLTTPQVSTSPPELSGDAAALTRQLGSPDGLIELALVSASVRLPRAYDLPSLRRCLVAYHNEILAPLELPVVYRACQHAGRGEVRELIALDQQLSQQPRLKDFAEASQRVGWSQLRQLRPLRDQRLVRRYILAVEQGEARAWHTIVYGVVLSLYSVPLRQGLLSYGWQTTNGFIQSAARSLRLPEADCQALLHELGEGLSPVVAQLLSRDGAPALLTV
ncbi:MAG: hypothetical protein HYY24_17350 [Verrucomicrobia bacterium]|nr:hypothetical protein [Verrucomicrobiota bacterium]